MYEKITRSKELSQTMRALVSEQHRLSEPVLTDLSQLERIRDVVKTNFPLLNEFRRRNYFIAVALLLYCPRTFVGKAIENGLRSAIARVAGVRHPQHVSSLATLIRTWLEYDRAFREQVDALCDTVVSELKEK